MTVREAHKLFQQLETMGLGGRSVAIDPELQDFWLKLSQELSGESSSSMEANICSVCISKNSKEKTND